MGQKINPIGFRLGINRTWDSRWFAEDDYATLLHQDLQLRNYLTERLTQAGVSRVVIDACIPFRRKPSATSSPNR